MSEGRKMSEVSWTKEQKQAIEEKGTNLLVAAAAGSGKTAVLVERIIHKIIDEKMDIDKMLVVTFTNAAASEMRERILDAIYKKIEENPEDIHMQRQITLLNKASICTIHSFCLDVIRNYFYEINIPANFQIGSSAEMELLKQETLEELLEEKYIKKDENFLKLIDTYASYRGDENLKDLILKIDSQIQSSPFPKDWLEEKVEMFNLKDKLEQDFSQTIWGKILLKELKEELTEAILKLEKIEANLRKYIELEKYANVILSDINEIEKIINVINRKDENAWNQIYEATKIKDFAKWPIDKKITIDYKNEAKDARNKIRKAVNSSLEKIMVYSSKDANETINDMYPILKSLKDIILEFEEKFKENKLKKNRIDFHDIEHYALEILIKEEDGKYVPSNIAKEIQERFEEIAIDEYQDSNLVQEYILNSVSRGNNIFMVGDIKQSIYRFRQARPELFLEKYRNYSKIEEVENSNNAKGEEKNENIKHELEEMTQKGQMMQKETSKMRHRKIQLFKNFRSRAEVLEITNWVFEQIMSEKLGDVEYNEEEFLNLGADYPENSKELLIPECHILDLEAYEANEEDEKEIQEETEKNETDDEQEESQIIEKNVEEAKLVANRIEELLNSNFKIFDKKTKALRKLEFRDIAILLRSTTNVAPVYEKELLSRGIDVYSDTSTQYLDSTEIQTIISLLKIIDNPMQDIPLVLVLRSPIGNFTDNELVEIRIVEQKSYFYEAMLKARVSVKEELRQKIDTFVNMLENWRKDQKEKPLDELIWQIYQETNYYYYVGLLNNGNLRQANLKMLFERAKQYESASFKGLYNFICFINRLKLNSGDLSAAKVIGENDNVVRIMSIHKSKGLEFPVVFLSGTGKQFNKQDLNDSILIHQDLGFGPKFIDSVNRIEYPTLAKEALKLKLETELISEEMRVLYVALTRAKEKLIITGVTKGFEKKCKEKEELLFLYQKQNTNKIEERLLKKYVSYLDWLVLLNLKAPQQEKIKFFVHKVEKSKSEQSEENHEEVAENKKIDIKELDNIKKVLSWKYKYNVLAKVPTKTSVSKLKEIKQKEEQDIDLEELLSKEKVHKYETPSFMVKENRTITSSRKGTLIHLCIQKLDETKEYKEQDIKNLINELVNKEIILKEEAEQIPVTGLVKYVQSDLWKELKAAKEIHKEEPFYMLIPANRIDESYPKDEKVLVQGIIDLYYINKNDELVLVDYKTDYVQKGEEQKLIDKYKEQLNLYKEALENSLGRKVNKVLIYSTQLGTVPNCDIFPIWDKV
jgi:ATP-dependent helicase/nuclease subunit A